MTEFQKQHGPFAISGEGMGGPAVMTWSTVDDRLRLVKQATDAAWLNAVIRDRDVQITVRTAAKRRLRQYFQKANRWNSATRLTGRIACN